MSTRDIKTEHDNKEQIMSLFDTFPSDTGAYRNYGQPVIVTQTDGSTVEGTIRWEDKSGAQVDIPSQDTGAYFSNEFITR